MPQASRDAGMLLFCDTMERNIADSPTSPLREGVNFNPERKQFAYVKEVTFRLRAASKGLRMGETLESIVMHTADSEEIAIQFKLRVGIK